MKAVMGDNLDWPSITGSLVTFLFAYFGVITLKDWSVIIAIVAGASTIIYNVIKTIKELKK